MPSRRRLATPTSVNRSSRTRALALAVAAFFLCVSLTAEAKKKKPAKKHKAPATSTKSKGSTKDAAPAEEAESDEASSDSKSSSKSADSGGDDEQGGQGGKEAKNDKPGASAEADADAEGSKGAAKVVRKAPAKAEPEGEGGAPFALRFGVGGKALFRSLTWTEANGALAPYSLTPGPESGIWLEAYPAAFATDSFAANIGIFGNFNYGFGASSKTAGANPVTLTTKYQDFLAGIKVRIPLGNIQPYVAGAFGQQKFHLEPADPSRPNFNYTVIHAGGGARVQFTPSIDADLGAGFLIVRDLGSLAGEVASSGLYPGATAYGFDATLSVGVRLASMVGVRLGADLRQMGVSLHWKSTDTGAKAGGAVDRYIGAWAGLEVVFDGLGGGSGESSSAPPPKAAPKAKKAEPEEGEPSGDSPAKEEKASDIE
jgi:hypothetical protein